MRSKYLVISICCHLVLGVVLIQLHFTLPEPPHDVMAPRQPIRSYIYRPKPNIVPPKPIAVVDAPKQAVAAQPMARSSPPSIQPAQPKQTPALRPRHQQGDAYSQPASNHKKSSLATRSLRSLRTIQTGQFLRDSTAEIQAPLTFNQQHSVARVKPRLPLAERRAIRVNCAKTGAKSLAVVSAIMGGSITCEELDELEGYISHRLGTGQSPH